MPEGYANVNCVRRLAQTCLLTFLMMLLLGKPAIADVPYTLEPASSHSMTQLIKMTGPLDFCGEPVPLDNPEVRERLEREFLLILWNRPQVILWMKRSGRYMPYIEEVLKQNNMPPDLKYIAVIESALTSHLSSSKGAKGSWQFIEGTGKKYGLKIDTDIDERRNFFSSTKAAVAYLKKLHDELGSWTLAAAAYNMGEEGLKAEMLLQNIKDYYYLYLPMETQQYVLRAVCVKEILSNPERYGFKVPKEDIYPPLMFDRVDVVCEHSTPVYIVAQAAKTYYKMIKDLNPEIRGHYLAKGEHPLLVPKGGGDGFQARYNDLLQKWLAMRNSHVYVVKKGESLSSIAASFDVPLPALLVWNNLSAKKQVKPGDRIYIFPAEEKGKK
ncbi:MAG TPA: transglycosylase SLT domain-containing protein [Syntrophales bacterium]|nr:transglycosylase SLT domain-containing protein [Syntrophales bacterium]